MPEEASRRRLPRPPKVGNHLAQRLERPRQSGRYIVSLKIGHRAARRIKSISSGIQSRKFPAASSMKLSIILQILNRWLFPASLETLETLWWCITWANPAVIARCRPMVSMDLIPIWPIGVRFLSFRPEAPEKASFIADLVFMHEEGKRCPMSRRLV